MSQLNCRVYIGPSLTVKEAEIILDAEYYPPIKRNDLAKIRHPKHYCIGIIDGVFHQDLAISIMEIREFIDKGGKVMGASSMGALRAMELMPMGMDGVGTIFKDYLKGKLTSDADVALAFSQETGQALTIPTVQVAHAVKVAKMQKWLPAKMARIALSRSRTIYYAERTLQSLRNIWSECIPQNILKKLMSILEDPDQDPKRQDAKTLLKHLRMYLDETSSEDNFCED